MKRDYWDEAKWIYASIEDLARKADSAASNAGHYKADAVAHAAQADAFRAATEAKVALLRSALLLAEMQAKTEKTNADTLKRLRAALHDDELDLDGLLAVVEEQAVEYRRLHDAEVSRQTKAARGSRQSLARAERESTVAVAAVVDGRVVEVQGHVDEQPEQPEQTEPWDARAFVDRMCGRGMRVSPIDLAPESLRSGSPVAAATLTVLGKLSRAPLPGGIKRVVEVKIVGDHEPPETLGGLTPAATPTLCKVVISVEHDDTGDVAEVVVPVCTAVSVLAVAAWAQAVLDARAALEPAGEE
ncbi:MAG: hypothetical protein EKK55_22630 [Rhodocyclaceae bacterium]|nr:MAG: hypothetical protein EKK55_22630 [Rhodocyclaceae bacterium]